MKNCVLRTCVNWNSRKYTTHNQLSVRYKSAIKFGLEELSSRFMDKGGEARAQTGLMLCDERPNYHLRTNQILPKNW